MNRKIYALYFSPTGNLKRLVCAAAAQIAQSFKEAEGESASVTIEEIDYTKAETRKQIFQFSEEDFLVAGMPVYAGRIPNKVMPELKESVNGSKTKAIAIVSFGNRNYDEGLRELVCLLEEKGCVTIGAAACVGEHAFSDALAPGRPDEADLVQLRTYVSKSFKEENPVNIDRETPIGPYYTPLKEDGTPAKFLKAKPKTKEDLCSRCKACVDVCPMQSIEADCVSVTGPCIKCQACIKVCEKQAKYFDDEAFLSHVAMLKKNYTDRKENVFL